MENGTIVFMKKNYNPCIQIHFKSFFSERFKKLNYLKTEKLGI